MVDVKSEGVEAEELGVQPLVAEPVPAGAAIKVDTPTPLTKLLPLTLSVIATVADWLSKLDNETTLGVVVMIDLFIIIFSLSSNPTKSLIAL